MKRLAITSTSCPQIHVEGVRIQHIPLLRVECVSFDAPAFDVAVFYSKNAVRCAAKNGLELGHCEVWAVGDSTADALQRAFSNIHPHVPSEHTFEGLVNALEATLASDATVLSIELEGGPRSLSSRIDNEVRAVVAYRTMTSQDDGVRTHLERADGVVFASPRAVAAYARMCDQRSGCFGSIGPTTTEALENHGFLPGSIVQVDPPDLDALVSAVAHQLLDG